MWAFRRLFNSTAKPHPLEGIVASQAKAIEKVMADQQKLIAKMQETIDRVVKTNYEKPIERIVHPVAVEQMPLWAMNDQGDVRPDSIEAGIQNLTAESDSDFLGAVN